MGAVTVKQISIRVPLDDWKRMQMEAAKRRISISELTCRWLEPEMKKLRDKETP